MSAAEKLKALDAMRDAKGDGHARWTVWDAIPQIVAVVEAAETIAPIMLVALRDSGMNATPGHMLGVALAALESALS